MEIGFSIALGYMASGYVKQAIGYASSAMHETASQYVPGYDYMSKKTEWVCSNPACKLALGNQTPKNTSPGIFALKFVIGENCSCGEPLKCSVNITPMMKYECIIGLCDGKVDPQTVMELYERRKINDANKKFTQEECTTIELCGIIVNNYLKGNARLLNKLSNTN